MCEVGDKNSVGDKATSHMVVTVGVEKGGEGCVKEVTKTQWETRRQVMWW